MREASHRNPALRLAGLTIVGAAVTGLMLAPLGCSRSFYRKQADDDARRLVLEKSQDPRWEIEDFSIEMDPRSRYYSPYDPDFPPMPPDDPASHEFMHQVDGKRGYAHWHDQYATISDLENPGWQEYLDEYAERTDDGAIAIDLQDAVRLAYLHSPDWQEQLETLYLSALDVSTERFRFDVQFLQSFSGSDLGFTSLGSERGRRPLTGRIGSTDTLSLDSDLRLRRQFATAGELLVGFANSVVWQFAGEDSTSTFSLLNFSLVQPLLRAGGRAVGLETLTISERGLLANVRALERFRKGMFTDIAVGDEGVSDLQRRGGFFGGTGLTGFTGQGAGGFGGVGQATGFGRGGFGGLGGGGGGGGGGGALGAGGGAGVVGGFIGLLQQLQQLRNREDNLNLQLRTLALLEANQQAGLIGLDQVLQFQQAIETERANLLQARNGLTTSIDFFLTGTLGLPPDIPVALDDSFIEQFQFIDPEMSALENDIARFIEEFGEIEQPTADDLQQAFEHMEDFHQRITRRFQIVQTDLQELEQASDEREQRMSPEEREQFRQTKQTLREAYENLRTRFGTIQGTLQELRAGLSPQTLQQSANRVVVLNTETSNLVGELSLVQVRARLESVVLDPVRLSPQAALEIARTHRLDWMNNRAALVDTWRLIEFNANDLKSNLDIELSGDLNTVGDNPLKFRDDQGRLSAALRFDAPFTRLRERNSFRQQLINYQQARRQLIQFEDGINRSMRQTLRNLEQLEQNLEFQRRAVTIAARRVDQARLNLSRPIPPPEPGQPPEQFGPTAARDLVDALEALRDAQNNFMSVWVNYYAGRMLLMRDLGIMRIDENGMWIEESIEEAVRAKAEQSPMPPPVPDQWLQELQPLREDSGLYGPADAADPDTGPGDAPQAPMPVEGPTLNLQSAPRHRAWGHSRTDHRG